MNFAAWTVLAVVLGAATAFADATTSPGKNSVYVSKLGAPISNAGANVSATIAKGKSKTVLEVDVVVTDTTGSDPAVGASVTVNGVAAAEPSSGVLQVADCNSGFICTLGSQWWLDLDAAEAAHPGMFKGQPLVVSADIFSNTATSMADISLRARMEKK
jgi:hypothetical protein